MADRSKRALFDDSERRIDLGPLLRIAAWGVGAVGAIAIAVFAGRSEMGERRIATGGQASYDATRAATSQALARAAEAERESRRLAETVRALTADRDQLAGRVLALERSIEDLTGSISLTQPTRRPALVDMLLPSATGGLRPPDDAPPRPGPFPDPAGPGYAIQTTPRAPAASETGGGPADAAGPAEIPLPRPSPLNPNHEATPGTPAGPAAADPAAVLSGRGPFGVDLGAAASVEGLRGLWSRIRSGQSSALVAELRPLVSVRDTAQPGTVELRLVAGPVATAQAASRLCAAIAASGASCRATPYEGQTLATP